jgi:hypothetical protein
MNQEIQVFKLTSRNKMLMGGSVKHNILKKDWSEMNCLRMK